MAQSIVCGGCGSTVAYGRLSCPECGEMLASVAGAVRRSSSVATAEAPIAAPPAPSILREVVPLTNGSTNSHEVIEGQLSTWSEPSDGDQADLRFDDEEPPVATPPAAPGLSPYAASLAAVRQAADPAPAASPTPVQPVPAAPVPAASVPAAPVPAEARVVMEPAPAVAAAPIAAVPAQVAAPAIEASPAPLPAAAAAPPPAAPAAAMPAARPLPGSAPPPGAYVPPVLQPAGSTAPARAWAGHDPAVNDAAVAAGAGAIGTTPAAGADEALTDRAKASEFVGWLAIAGTALALVGFLLPWSSISVIGADGVGYFDRWGFAGPWHILIVIGLLAVLAAAIMRDRVPAWLGIGLPGLGVGALLIGLVWPYLIGPLDGSLGAMATALGSLMLIGAGIGAIVVDRHGRTVRSV
jgi:hypothetical protein